MADGYKNMDAQIRNLSGEDEFFVDVEIWALSEITNRNRWLFENIAEHKNGFCGTPILTAYVNRGRTVGDGHNFGMTTDPETGDRVPDFRAETAERIIGAYYEDPSAIRVENVDGIDWIVGNARLWKWYAREAVNKIVEKTRNGEPMNVSIEALVTNETVDEEGVSHELEYTILGTTVLGDGIAPAVEDARIVALQEITSEFEELKLRAASYIDNSDGDTEPNTDEPEDIPKPQINFITNEGVNTLKALNKKQLAELSPKFDGYTVLSAGQDENGIHVCLMSADGTAAIYTMESLNDVVVLEKVAKLNTTISFEFGEDCSLNVDTCDVIDRFVADALKANNEIGSLQAKLDAADETIRTMKENELKRRINSAHAKALDTLTKFNANRTDKVSADVLTKINEAIDNGDYSECENSDGCWAGEEKVEEAVLAACAAQVMEMDKASAAKSRTDYIWNQVGSPAPTTGVGALLTSFGIK